MATGVRRTEVEPGSTLRAEAAAAPLPVVIGAVAVGYSGLALYGIWLSRVMPIGTGLWPATAVTAAALLLLPRRRWPVVLLTVAIVESSLLLFLGSPPSAIVWWALGTVLGPWSGVSVFLRRVGPDWSLARLGDVLIFILAVAGLTPAVGAAFGTIGSATMGSIWAEAWPTSLLGASLGMVTVTPLLVAWRIPGPDRSPTETAVLGAVVVGTVFVVFGGLGPLAGSTFYLVAPPLLWAALRTGVRGTAIAVTAVVHLANLITATGHGPFAAGVAVLDPLAMQLFLVVVAATSLAIAALAEDLADRVEVEGLLRHRAEHDPLTDLPNRPSATAALEALLAAPQRRPAVILGDIDRLKRVNEDHGQAAGDRVLSTLAQRLRRAVGDRGTVSRWSGDQFLIVVDEDDIEAPDLAEEVLAATRAPIEVTDEVRTTVSVCLGVVPSGEVTDVADLIVRADLALDRAKERGPGSTSIFDQDLRRRVLDRQLIERDLGPAIRGGQLHCVYQPEVDLRTGALVAFECLCRWDHPTTGPIGPDRFIPVAEATGDIHALFDLVLTRALETQSRWSTRVGFRPIVAVNLSARQLSDPELPAIVARALTRANATADGLWLEVTETAIADGPQLPVLNELHELGVRLAIDDFGTGWSSMVRLSAFPWDALKIDRSFVRHLGTTPESVHIVRASIELAHALGMRAIAEGVETARQAAILADLGCDLAQGYRYARPLHPREAIAAIDGDGRWVPVTTDDA